MDDDRARKSNTWGMLCHLTALSGYIGVPFGHVLGPLVIWLIKKNEYPFVDSQGKESLNFQITVSLLAVVCGLLTIILIGWVLLIALAVYSIVMVVIASVNASNGKPFRYPFTLRLIK